VRESIELRVVRGGADRVGGEFDAGNLGEVRSEGEREKPGAGIGVYEVGWRWRQGARKNRGKMALPRTYEVKGTSTNCSSSESACLVIEEQLADAFPDSRFVICDADVIVLRWLQGSCRPVSRASRGTRAWKMTVSDVYISLRATKWAQRRLGQLRALTSRYCRALERLLAMRHSYDEDICYLTILVRDAPYRYIRYDSLSSLILSGPVLLHPRAGSRVSFDNVV
jgi:hypothetical protein